MAQNGPQIRRITWVGLILNTILSVLKIVGGLLGNSKALVADAIHSISDLSTDIAVLVGSYYWSQPPDNEHPHGHRRIETLITLAIGLCVGAVGVFLTIDAISSLRRANHSNPNILAALAALVSIISKEILFRWTAKHARILRSPALAANAWHHRSDAFSSIPVLATVVITMFLPAWSFLDAAGAAVVAGFILKAALDILRPALREIMDTGAPAEVAARIRHTALNTPGVLDVHDLRTRYIGNEIQADLHVVVSENISVREGHRISDLVVKSVLEEENGVVDVLVHIDPWDDSKQPGENKKFPPPV